jgi:hypothetical protein
MKKPGPLAPHVGEGLKGNNEIAWRVFYYYAALTPAVIFVLKLVHSSSKNSDCAEIRSGAMMSIFNALKVHHHGRDTPIYSLTSLSVFGRYQ